GLQKAWRVLKNLSDNPIGMKVNVGLGYRFVLSMNNYAGANRLSAGGYKLESYAVFSVVKYFNLPAVIFIARCRLKLRKVVFYFPEIMINAKTAFRFKLRRSYTYLLYGFLRHIAVFVGSVDIQFGFIIMFIPLSMP